MKFRPFEKILVANRSEIAIRIMRAIHELNQRSVAIFSADDRLALHRFKAHEAYQVGAGKSPVEAYLDIRDILRIAHESGCDAVHPGYGFLAENPDFARACSDAGMVFIGPSPGVLRQFGNKVSAKQMAAAVNVPIIPASPPLGKEVQDWVSAAEQIGLPVMLKASWGGGGRGMRVIRTRAEVKEAVSIARREAHAAFGNDEVFFEKLLENARHVDRRPVW